MRLEMFAELLSSLSTTSLVKIGFGVLQDYFEITNEQMVGSQNRAFSSMGLLRMNHHRHSSKGAANQLKMLCNLACHYSVEKVKTACPCTNRVE